MRLLEHQLQRPLREVLLNDFADSPIEEIADHFQVSVRTIERWLDRLDIERRLVLVERQIHEPESSTDSNGRGKGHEARANAVEGSPSLAHEGA